jgi:hypothetical protein
VCTGHCTVQCPVHRQPRAKIQFSCALSGGSPDSYCAQSGVHRTGTVDCPVRPSRVLKKGLQPAEPSQRLTLFPSARALCSLATPSPPPAISDHRRPPSSTVLRRHRAPLLPPFGEKLWLPLSPLYFFLSRALHSISFAQTPNPCQILQIQLVE